MPRANLKTTTFDAEELKQALIEYLESTNEFGDFNYEGSAINTIIDLLTRDTVYNAFLANMLANESFIESAQIRGNVSAHAQKLSYVPNSRTSARLFADIEITPATAVTQTNPITGMRGIVFLASVNGNTYSFTTRDIYSFSYSSVKNKFVANDVEMYQGQLISTSFSYNNEPIIIDNDRVDISTLRVSVNDIEHTKASSIAEFGDNENLFFLRERTDGKYEIDFGNNILGVEPTLGDRIDIQYINTENEHANGVKNLVAASSIDGYSNISVNVTTNSFGGKDRDDIEFIRFIAPKIYQAQDRALAEFDYVAIVKSEFPFIKSAIAWGGENNVPPRYGAVFLSLLTSDDIIITDSLARIIEQHIKTKMVGSVLPIVTTPVFFTMELEVEYSYNKGRSNKSVSEIESYIKNTVFDYSDNVMNEFGGYYNHSEVVSRLKDNTAIESIAINEVVKYSLPTYKNIKSAYTVDFDNSIVRGSLSAKDFMLYDNATEHKMYDDGEGNVVVSYMRNGNAKTQTIGTLDYDTGDMVITANFVQEANNIEISITPKEENFYVRRNHVVKIDECKTKEMIR